MGIQERINAIREQQIREKAAAEAAAKSLAEEIVLKAREEEQKRIAVANEAYQAKLEEHNAKVIRAESDLERIQARRLLTEAQEDIWEGYGSIAEASFHEIYGFHHPDLPAYNLPQARRYATARDIPSDGNLRDASTLILSYDYKDGYYKNKGYVNGKGDGVDEFVVTGREWHPFMSTISVCLGIGERKPDWLPIIFVSMNGRMRDFRDYERFEHSQLKPWEIAENLLARGFASGMTRPQELNPALRWRDLSPVLRGLFGLR